MKRFYLLSVICFLSTGIFAQENTGEERTLSADSIITSDARLDSIYQSLPEVMITGERPVVKASQGNRTALCFAEEHPCKPDRKSRSDV